MSYKPPLEKVQLYLPPDIIDQICTLYPGLKTSQAIRSWIMSQMQTQTGQAAHPDQQLQRKEITPNIKPRRPINYSSTRRRLPGATLEGGEHERD